MVHDASRGHQGAIRTTPMDLGGRPRGAPVAVIGPPRVRFVSGERFRELIATAPRPDEDFAEDLRTVRESAGPPREPWPS